MNEHMSTAYNRARHMGSNQYESEFTVTAAMFLLHARGLPSLSQYLLPCLLTREPSSDFPH